MKVIGYYVRGVDGTYYNGTAQGTKDQWDAHVFPLTMENVVAAALALFPQAEIYYLEAILTEVN